MSFSFKKYINEGLALYRRIFFKLLPFCLFVAGVEVLTQAHIASLILHQLILDSIFSAGIFAYLLSMEKGQAGQFHFADFFQGAKRIGELLLLAVLLNVRIFFGFILLVLPAFYLMNLYSLSLYLLLEKRGDAFEVLKQSKALVRPQFWKVLGANLLLASFLLPELMAGPDSMMAAPFFFVWSVVTTPLSAALSFTLYRQLVPRNS